MHFLATRRVFQDLGLFVGHHCFFSFWAAAEAVAFRSADPSLVGVSEFMGSLASTATFAAELLPAAIDSLQLPLLPNSQMVLW